jgi:nitrogen-specific signal transduction histidine kinase
MKERTPYLVCTEDDALGRRIDGFLNRIAEVVHVRDIPALDDALDMLGATVAILDIRAPGVHDTLPELRRLRPALPVIILGARESEPVIAAEALGVYGTAPLDPDRRAFRLMVGRALQHAELQAETDALRTQALNGPADRGDGTGDAVQRLRHFFTPLRHGEDVDALARGVIDGIANAGIVLRAGLFVCDRDGQAYRLRAGLGCLPGTEALVFTPRDTLVRWLVRHAQLASRAALPRLTHAGERAALERALGRLGAELIVPLRGRQGVIGWIVLGPRATGEGFDPADFRDIMLFAEHVSTALENALLYEDATLQRAFAETLLHTIPTGIVAVNPDGRVEWFNEAAERILALQRDRVLALPAEGLGTQLAGMLRGALDTDGPGEARQWTDAATKRALSVRTARLHRGEACIGAVAFVHDLTREVMLNQKQRELERATFWTELAASMSHEVRNPLVAIKTFAQLLPERFDDNEFRTEFSALMTQEVDRLDGVIEQINRFANLPKPEMQPTDIREVLLKAIQSCRAILAERDIRLETSIPPGLPIVSGDQHALAEGFAHLLRNAAEALTGREAPRVTVTAQPAALSGGVPGVEVTVRDNGPGIPPDLQDKAFSPFCTTKAGGMGLGLPIIQRTVTDHNGRIEIDSSTRGTVVTVALPATADRQEAGRETSVDRGRRARQP